MTLDIEAPVHQWRVSSPPWPAAAPGDCRHGTAQDLLGLLGFPGNALARETAITVLFRRLPARATLYHEGSQAESIYVVHSGTFKCCRTDADGGERVLGFTRRGDVLGYGALGVGRHTSAAVALEPASVAVVPLADLFAWLQCLPALERALHQALSLQHARAEELSDAQNPVPAEVRLARFLLHWSHRMAISGQSMRQLKLAMGRRDIARLLGVAHETVSRSFASLAARGCLSVTGRTVDILDAAALEAATRSPLTLPSPSGQGAEGQRAPRVHVLP